MTATFISCTAFFPKPRTQLSSRHAQPMVRRLHRRFGGTTFLRPNFTRKKARRSVYNCSKTLLSWPNRRGLAQCFLASEPLFGVWNLGFGSFPVDSCADVLC